MTKDSFSNAESSGNGEQLEETAQRVASDFRTVEEMTEAFLREAILRGLYRPGERLQQDNIARLLGVSRMPVRASLAQLETEGLLTITPYKGAIVSELSFGEISEVYDLRIMVETYLLESAMNKLTPEILNELKKLAGGFDKDVYKSKSEWLERRKIFYERLYQLAERPRALAFAQQLRNSVGRYLLLQRVDQTPEPHMGLLKYLDAGDVEGAKQWLTEHLSKVSSQLQRLVGDGN
jgi:DNA-binding GntR family transcriptional regulator